jgi:hypothetical protein
LTLRALDQAVGYVLTLKFKLGLFDRERSGRDPGGAEVGRSRWLRLVQ